MNPAITRRIRRSAPGALLLAAALAFSIPSVGAEPKPIVALQDVATTPSAVKPAKVGDKAPSARVVTPDGEQIALSDIYSSAPTVLIFYRGGWCPYCNVHLASLATIEKELTDAGYQIVALSSDAPRYLQETAAKNQTAYRLLSDSDVEAARAFGLAFRVDDATVERYLGFKSPIDLEARSGGLKHHVLPVPAAYVIDKSGVIRYAHWNPDYKNRIDAQELLKAALEIRKQ